MARFTNVSLVVLSLLFSRAAAFPAVLPRAIESDVAYAFADDNGEMIGYYADGTVAGVLPPANQLQARQGNGCKLISVDEAKSLDGWEDIENYAHENWGDGSYNLGNEFEGRSALVCVDGEPQPLSADANPSCSSKESETGGKLVGTDGWVDISYTQGYSTTGTWTVTESTMLGSSLTASVGFSIPDVLELGVETTITTEVTNTATESFSTTNESKDTQSVRLNAPEGKTCKLRFTSKNCSVQGSGKVKYIASGWMWFNYDDKTEGHYRWAVNIENVVPDVNRRSSEASVRGQISGTATSEYEGSCE
ncbi:hypothetical protein BDV98DRAFT_504512 [Pterulicium gracile]|uniref:Uncharacterized protein n=1 Tax=Pterulicium gracile TaxID=1884261 RepID=A0A5C3QSG7_9AGAR|nr:hypothetical protein BDV98DRAFT_384423 [Pterula gracilis]TFL03471.1 hypothetical protein BDV98DRAFT_504512 [Pterula gracilis]